MTKKLKNIFIFFITISLMLLILMDFLSTRILHFTDLPSKQYIDKSFFREHIGEYSKVGEYILNNNINCYKTKYYKYYLQCNNKNISSDLKNILEDLKITDFYNQNGKIIIFVKYSTFGFYEEMYIYKKNVKSIFIEKEYGTPLEYINSDWILIKYL